MSRCASPPESVDSGWPERQVPEPDPHDRVERPAQDVVAIGRRIEQRERLVDAHREHVGDRPAAVGDREHLRLEALALADRAEKLHVREKLHLDRLVAFARALLAAAGGDVEREVRGRQPAAQRLGLGGEARADAIPGLDVRGRVAARRPTERRLIDQDGASQLPEPVERVVLSGPVDREVPEAARGGPVEDVVGERRLAGAARAP